MRGRPDAVRRRRLWFDDDDYYAPAYVERMLALLGDDDYLTLSGWFLYSLVHAKFCYWETDALSPVHFVLSSYDKFLPVSPAGMAPESVRPHVNGYGFASAWRRRVADVVRFPDRDHGEDEEFVDGVVNAGLRTWYAADVEGLALHLVHHDNISRTFPQYVLPEFLLAKYLPGYTPPVADA